MNEKNKRFAREYLIDRNGTQAAIRAGYSPKTAKVQASMLLTYPDIKEFIKQRELKISDKLEVTAERVIARIAYVAFDKEQVRDGDTLKACELLGRNLGMFVDKLQIDESAVPTRIILQVEDASKPRS